MRQLMVTAAACLAATSALAQVKPVVTSPLPAENRANAAVANAPSILVAASGQSDSCAGVNSLGYGTPMIGATIVFQHNDRACARIRKAKTLQLLGYGAAAVQVMCQDKDVRKAMTAGGTPCELQKAQP